MDWPLELPIGQTFDAARHVRVELRGGGSTVFFQKVIGRTMSSTGSWLWVTLGNGLVLFARQRTLKEDAAVGAQPASSPGDERRRAALDSSHGCLRSP